MYINIHMYIYTYVVFWAAAGCGWISILKKYIYLQTYKYIGIFMSLYGLPRMWLDINMYKHVYVKFINIYIHIYIYIRMSLFGLPQDVAGYFFSNTYRYI